MFENIIHYFRFGKMLPIYVNRETNNFFLSCLMGYKTDNTHFEFSEFVFGTFCICLEWWNVMDYKLWNAIKD